MRNGAVMLVLGTVVAVILVAFLAGVINCVLYQRTCPPGGSLREALEDVTTALVGFVAGRKTAPKP